MGEEEFKQLIEKQIKFVGSLYNKANDSSEIDGIDELYQVLEAIKTDKIPLQNKEVKQ